MHNMTRTQWGLLTVMFVTLLAAYFAPSPDNEVQPTKEVFIPTKSSTNSSIVENVNNDIKVPNELTPNFKPDVRVMLDEPPLDLFYREQPKVTKITTIANNAFKPTAPTLPFIYMGKLAAKDNLSVFLTRDNYPYVVHIGDVIDDEYRIDAINSTLIEMTYLPLSQKQTLSMIGANNGARSSTTESQFNARSTSITDTETQRIRKALSKLMGQTKGKQE